MVSSPGTPCLQLKPNPVVSVDVEGVLFLCGQCVCSISAYSVLGLPEKKRSVNTFPKWKPPWFKNHSSFIGDGPHLSFAHSCSFKGFFLFSFSQRQALYSALLLASALSIHFLASRFQAVFPLCHLFPLLDGGRYGKASLKWVGLGSGYMLRRTDSVFLEEILILLHFLECWLIVAKMSVKQQHIRANSCLLV